MDYEEWDEDEETVEAPEEGTSVYDLAESHLQEEAKRFMRDEQYHKHLFDAKYGV